MLAKELLDVTVASAPWVTVASAPWEWAVGLRYSTQIGSLSGGQCGAGDRIGGCGVQDDLTSDAELAAARAELGELEPGSHDRSTAVHQLLATPTRRAGRP